MTPAVGIGAVLIAIGSFIRAAITFDMQLLKALTRHADLDRLGAQNRAQAAVRALARGVVSPEDLAGE